MTFEEKKVLGCYFKNIRKSRNLSISSVSASLNGVVSESCISEFENGKNNTTLTVIQILYNHLDIDFNFDNKYEIERENSIQVLVELYGRNHISKFDETILQICNNPEYKKSLFYPLFLICNFYKIIFIDERIDSKCIGAQIDEMNNVIKVMTAEEKLLYQILYYRYLFPLDGKSAYKHLLTAYMESKDIDSILASVIKYLLSFDEEHNKNYARQLLLLEEAAQTFSDNGYIERSMHCWMEMALAYNDFFDYDNALKFNHKALRIAEQINDNRRMDGIINNMGIIYYDMKEYDKAMFYANKLVDNELFSESAYSIIVSSELCLEHYPEAKVALNKLIRLNDESSNEYYRHLIKVKKALLYDKKGPHYYAALKAYLKYAKRNLSSSRCIRVYEQIIDYCKEHQMKEELPGYYQGLLDCFEKIKNYKNTAQISR